MANRKNDTGTSGQKYSVNEIAQKTAEQERLNAIFQATRNAVNLVDLTKTETRTFQTFSKSLLRTYLTNPLNYQERLRGLSQFLYRLSYPYRRIIWYYATQLDCTMWLCEPQVDFIKSNNDNKTLKDYAKVVTQVRKMDMPSQILKFMILLFKEGACFGYAYEDNDGFFIMPLDADYCRISSQNYDGTYNMAFDFSYFRSRQYLLDYWADEFRKKYAAYEKDSSLRWQEVGTENGNSFVLKMDQEDSTLILPVFLPLFSSIIDLLDLESVQAVKDSLSAYKMVVMVEKTLEKATEPDQFCVDIDSAVAFYNRLAASLPPEVSSAISLLPIEVIDFKGTTPEDTERLSNAMKNLFTNAGTSNIFSQKLEGTTAFQASIIADSTLGLAVRPNLQKWVNRYIQMHIGNVSTKVVYLKATPYTQGDMYTKALEGSALGLPMRQMAMSAMGIDPASTYYLNYLETELLKYPETFIPLNSSYTQSGKQPAGNTGAQIDKGGRPADTGEIKTNITTTETKSETSTTSAE